MEENMKNRIVPATAREANIDADYIRWISDVKTRYRQSQIKASLSVNSYVLEFYWGLGHDIVKIRNAHKYGSGIMDQISLDLKAREIQISHKLCENWNRQVFPRFWV